MLEGPLKAIGYKVANDGAVLPFPSTRQQGKFHDWLQQLLTEKNIKL